MHRFLYTAALVLIAGYLIWPYGSLLRFYFALKSANETIVEQMVNWPSVHAAIEQQINRTMGAYLNQKILSTDPTSPAKLKLSFDSISIANEIATKLATPKSFIFLFKHPNKLHCIWSLKESEAKDTKDDCRLTVENEKSDETGSSEFRGPNFARVYAKTNHLFFTDPFTFKFDVQHEDIRLVLIFARQSLGWKLTTLSADWNKALSDPG